MSPEGAYRVVVSRVYTKPGHRERSVVLYSGAHQTARRLYKILLRLERVTDSLTVRIESGDDLDLDDEG